MYKLTGDENIVLRVEDQLFIPNGNPLWEEYQAWLAEGNIPEPRFTDAELSAQHLAEVIEKLNSLSRQANAQVIAIQGRVTTLDFAVNGQDPDDPEYIPPLDSEIAELPVRVAQLKAWNLYSTRLGRVKLQATWPSTPVWPAMPEPYTSEVSAMSQPAA